MPKRPYQPDGRPRPTRSHLDWSIGSNGLTKDGQSELMKQLGRQLRAGYQAIVDEPTPERFRQLMKSLEERRGSGDEEN